jgi:hypothetical protein
MYSRTMRRHHERHRMIIIRRTSDREDGTGHYDLNSKTCLPETLHHEDLSRQGICSILFSKHNGKGTIVLAGLSIKTLLLMGWGLRRAARIVKIACRSGASGFELTLAPSGENPRRYAIESVKQIDRRAVLETLRTSGLVNTLLPKGFLYREGRAKVSTGKASAVPRITLIRLTPRQTLSAFNAIRARERDVRKLYAHLKEKDFDLIGKRAQGSVMRAYAADGIVRGEGVVMELPHEGAAGADASFNVSVKDRMDSEGEAKSCEVRADYVIRRGKQAGTYTIEEVRPHLCKKERPGREGHMDVGQER